MGCVPCLQRPSQYQPLDSSETKFETFRSTQYLPPRNSSLINTTAMPYSCDKSGAIQNRSNLPRFEEMLQNDFIVRITLTPNVAM
ncbi:hypothetical protein K7432_001754 [Basidiobolus ranarum]|uniref:Uncharacterized protein n=1 Tax=Basidiobolus ranarum TaxID=34480 RepID=A0ABR2X2J7_9FUNG